MTTDDGKAGERTIMKLQDSVNAALLESNWRVLTELVADEARIIGPRGFIISREEWLGAHRDAGYEQVRLDPIETEVFAYDNAGVRVDLVESECVYHGERISGRFRVSQTWVTSNGEWRLAAVQYTAANAA